VQGAPAARDPGVARQQAVVERFLAALRAGDVEALIAVLDPDFVATGPGADRSGDLQDARAWASRAIQNARGARAARLALVDGGVGLVVAPRGRLLRALLFQLSGDRVARVDVVGEPDRLAALRIALLE
jgi:RNA polymerase sigma-70 factor (ECF subfamily)